jgi:hypothetical protein
LTAQGINELAIQGTQSISKFFLSQLNPRVAVTKFENYTNLSDLACQRFYQLFVSQLEKLPNLAYYDLMINFSNKTGTFNLKRSEEASYLIYLRLIQHYQKLGLGMVIFSKDVNKIVYIDYKEVTYSNHELSLLDATDYGFSEVGFSKVIQTAVNRDLLDLYSIIRSEGVSEHFLLYPDQIEIFQSEAKILKKTATIPLKWERPYFPTLHPEGRLFYFQWNGVEYFSAGANFSEYGKIYQFKNNGWQEFSRTEVVLLTKISLNDRIYLVGGKYIAGKNYFDKYVKLIPLLPAELVLKEAYKKPLPYFYAIDFAKNNQELISIHLVDYDYKFKTYSADFELLVQEEEKFGAALAVDRLKWVALSNYSIGNDQINFFQIENGKVQKIYKNKIQAEIRFIRSGYLKSQAGFWVYTVKETEKVNDYHLQFWGIGHE